MNLISIIVPIFNAENFINECIDSVLKQTYSNWELILIDDGSTDKSWDICIKNATADTRVHVFRQVNKGVTAARKNGWQQSNGEWIVFLDSDDKLQPNCLQVLLSNAINEDCDVVNAGFVSIGKDNRKWIHKYLGIMNQRRYLESFIKNETYGTVYASIYKKSLFEESTFNIDSSIKIGEDFLQNLELSLRTRRALNISDIVYSYVDNENSVMNKKIMHPRYVERFFEIGDKLIAKNEDIPAQFFSIRETQKLNSLLHSYFSPYLPIDKDYSVRLRNLLNGKSSSSFPGRNKIYFYVVRLRQASLLKSILYILVFFKQKLKGEKHLKRQILT